MEGHHPESSQHEPVRTAAAERMAERMDAHETKRDAVLRLAHTALQICYPRDNSDFGKKHPAFDVTLTRLDSAIQALERATPQTLSSAANEVLLALQLLPDAWSQAAQSDVALVRHTETQLMKHTKDIETYNTTLPTFTDEQQRRITQVFNWRINEKNPADITAVAQTLRSWIDMQLDQIHASVSTVH